jgi:rod shape-determining protein MreC
MAISLSAHRNQLVLAALIVAHLLAISWQVETSQHIPLIEQLALAVLSPFQRLLASSGRGLGATYHRYVDLRGAREESLRLTERVRELELALAQREHLAQQATRLRELLALRALLPLDTVAAELVASEGMPWASKVTVNRGSAEGVTLNMPVISHTGVVGRVIALGPHAAKVQLILDHASGVGVLVERSRTIGVLEGLSEDSDAGDLPMRFVPALADVKVGDTVVTSGLDQIYPKGLTVGVVSRVLPATGLVKDVFVAPSARFHEMEEVLLVRVPAGSLEMPESVR